MIFHDVKQGEIEVELLMIADAGIGSGIWHPASKKKACGQLVSPAGRFNQCQAKANARLLRVLLLCNECASLLVYLLHGERLCLLDLQKNSAEMNFFRFRLI